MNGGYLTCLFLSRVDTQVYWISMTSFHLYEQLKGR